MDNRLANRIVARIRGGFKSRPVRKSWGASAAFVIVLTLSGVASAGTSTVTVSWTGGHCAVCDGDYACSNNYGNWNGGMRSFTDPLPPGAILNQVDATVYGALGCDGMADIAIQLQATTVGEQVLSGGCNCDTCEVHTFSSPIIPGWPGYDYGGTETLFLNVRSGLVCINRVEITLTWLDSCGDGVLDPGESCDDGNLDNGDGCNLVCQVEPCWSCSGEPSVCMPLPDGAACDDNLFCNGTDTCSSGTCTPAGDPCVAGAECQDTCNESQNACASVAGTPCTDDGNVCTNDQCDGSGVCAHPANFYFPCDDGLFCNGDDLCFGGTCSLHDGNPCAFTDCAQGCDEMNAVCIASTAGTQCFDDGAICTTDECNGLGTCVHPPKASGTPCFSDANVCTLDACDGTGLCAHPPVPNGTACPADSNVCTLDQCIAGGCAHPPVANGVPCDDANACTQQDSCQGGACLGGNPVICPLPLCQAAETCDPTSGLCTKCPQGYTQGNGGCQKVYEIDNTLLDNLAPCSGIHWYNGCSAIAFGFHWTDTGDTAVGDVIGVDVEFTPGLSCNAADHRVTLNATSIGEFASESFCSCSGPSQPTLTFTDVDTSVYAKGGLNSVLIDSPNCDGLNADPDGAFGAVTVTYAAPAPTVAIRNGCRPAAKSKLNYRNDTTGVNDKLKWKWSNGAATAQNELADPTASTGYQLCVYSETDAGPTLLLGAEVPSSSTLWKEIGSRGYAYKDKDAAQGGISKIIAKSGAATKAKILVKGAGAALSDPVLPLAPGTSALRVQLTNESSGVCWESAFPFGTAQVDDDSIKAKAP